MSVSPHPPPRLFRGPFLHSLRFFFARLSCFLDLGCISQYTCHSSYYKCTADRLTVAWFRGLYPSRVLRTFAAPALSPISPMKRSRSRRSRKLGIACGEDNITAISTSDSDEQGDATYETDLTEADDSPSPRKRLRSDENCSVLELGLPGELAEYYDDPVDDDGIDLSEIPEDIDGDLHLEYTM